MVSGNCRHGLAGVCCGGSIEELLVGRSTLARAAGGVVRRAERLRDGQGRACMA
jgi:hypothetical protein